MFYSVNRLLLNYEMENRPSGPLARYKNLVDQGKLQHDPHQERVALELEKLLGRLEKYEKDMEEYHVQFGSFGSLYYMILSIYVIRWETLQYSFLP